MSICHHNIRVGIVYVFKENGEVRSMVVWEDLQVSLLEITSYSYNLTKDSLINTQTHLRDSYIETSEGAHIEASRGSRMGKRTKTTETGSWRCSLVLATAPTDSMAVKGWGAIFTGQTRWEEAAIGPGQLIHLEAEPRVRRRAVVQRVAEFYKLSSPKNAAAVRTWPFHPPCGPHSIKSLTQWIEKWQKQHSSLSGLYSLWPNLLKRTKPQTCEPSSPWSPFPNLSSQSLVEAAEALQTEWCS